MSVIRVAPLKENTSGAVRAGERVFLSGAQRPSAGRKRQRPWRSRSADPCGARSVADGDEAAGGSLRSITKLTTCVVDRGYRTAVYAVIARAAAECAPGQHRARRRRPAAARADRPDRRRGRDPELRRARRVGPTPSRTGTDRALPGKARWWSRPTTSSSSAGQTGGRLDHSGTSGQGPHGRGRRRAGRPRDDQNLATLLGEAGSSLDDVCKLTVYISDRAYRAAVYPMIGKHFRRRPAGLDRDHHDRLCAARHAVRARRPGAPASGAASRIERLRPYHSSAARYGHHGQQLDCEFCMAVVAGRPRHPARPDRHGLGREVMHGAGDGRRRPSRRWTMSRRLLAEAGASLSDVVKATVYVTDRAFLADVNAAVLRRLAGVRPAFNAVIVKGLASPELLMEVDITAVQRGRSMTFSLLGRCARTGMLGAVVTTSSIAVGSRCPFAAAGVGAALTQHHHRPAARTARARSPAPRLYSRAGDRTPWSAATPHSDWRQLAIIDARRPHARSFSGERASSRSSAEAHGRDCVALGNIVRSRRGTGRDGARLRGRYRRRRWRRG